MFSSDELLANPLVRNVLSPDEIQLAEADEDWLPNEVLEKCKTVFTLGWDSSMPGSCGASWINEWRGLYFFTSSDLDPEGPFADLDEALNVEYFWTFSSNHSLWSDVIPLEELLDIAAARFDSEEGETIQINDKTYALTQTGFVLQQELEGGQP